MNTISFSGNTIACHDCDLLQTLPALQEGESARCCRCDALLYQRKRDSLNRSLAFALTGLILFAVANFFPFLSLNAQGQIQDSTLISGSIALWQDDRPMLSILVALTTIVFPLLDLAGMLYILISLRIGWRPPRLRALYRLLQSTQPWGMLEVFMLAVLVAAVKLGDLASVIPGIAIYSFALLVFVLAALSASLDPHLIWNPQETET
ncbi:MAG TPA: paraquat-inducible protein A [Gammaproteobacteria bacterium]|nr:paraquat-inducible protein A [Gammaproteobacteria bacterium]